MKRFLRLTQEPVIMDFHRFKNNAKPIKIVFRFPFGFDGDDQAARHEDLVRYLQVRSMLGRDPQVSTANDSEMCRVCYS